MPPRRLQPKVPLDLETICLKCLRKEPGQRYPTAEALAEDLSRFQAGEPILARPTSAIERTVKWVKRRPLVASLLLAIGLLVTVSLAVLTWQLGVTLDALAKAEAAHEGKRKESEAKLAAQDLALARVHWNFNEISKAKEYLARVPPEHRDREWRYVHRLCHAELTQFPAPPFWESYLGWHPDGEQVVVCSLDQVQLLNTRTRGERRHTLPSSPKAASIAQDGKTLSFLPEVKPTKVKKPPSTFVYLFDLETGEPGAKYQVPGGWLLSPQGAFVAGIDPLVGTTQTIQVWEVATGKVISELSLPKSKSPRGLRAISADGKRLACWGQGQDKRPCWEVWDVATGKLVDSIPLPTLPNLDPGVRLTFSGFKFSPDGTRALYTVKYDTREFELGRFSVHLAVIEPQKQNLLLARDVVSLRFGGAFSPDGTRVAWAGHHATLVVGDAGTGKEILVLRGHIGGMMGAAFSPDGQRLVSSGADRILRVWDTSPLQ
ncbi:MAG: hypothetical protein L0Z62_47080 [Gemmataceae bacterium]|nr:hypothetical protein [Gemmataceae bacterium]